jgi:HAD superfamily hydrolase (TIGR01490 family)
MCIGAHRTAGRRTVLVTGSIDFIIAPLAESLGVDEVIAPGLLTENGRFTGALDGPPVGMEEKARRIAAFARAHDIDLAASFAYGDSKADLPMLEAVGHPQVVNPDKVLRMIAIHRGWPVHRWTLPEASRKRR